MISNQRTGPGKLVGLSGFDARSSNFDSPTCSGFRILFWPADVFEDWQTAAGVAQAFKIGPKESKAVRELFLNVPHDICTRLEDAVKQRGLTLLLNHDAIGNGCFSTGFSSGTGAVEHWHDHLTNLSDNLELVP